MIRPLDVEQILKYKAAHTPAQEKISFSIEDPILSENNGTYTIEGNEVKKSPLPGRTEYPFIYFLPLSLGHSH
jgi:hypothetical protein